MSLTLIRMHGVSSPLNCIIQQQIIRPCANLNSYEMKGQQPASIVPEDSGSVNVQFLYIILVIGDAINIYSLLLKAFAFV